MRNAMLICALVGCHYSPSSPNTGDDGPGGDAAIDMPNGAEPVPADAQACFGTAPFTVCLTTQPTMPIDLASLDTSTSPLCLDPLPASWTGANQPDSCIVVGTNITLASGTIADIDGTRPLVLVATGTLTISGTLDLSSKAMGGDRGPASSTDVSCNAGNGQTNGNKGGGGGGGGFGIGGNVGGTANGSAGTAGTAGEDELPPHDKLRGGCRGGGGAQGGDNPVSGGHGGGAAFLVGATVVIDGVVNASGAGGTGGDADKGGGGGGGSGGMIVIDGNTVTVTGTLIANGGGGGGGAEASNNGGIGSDPNPANPTTPANGGPKANGGPAGVGGKGAAGATVPEAGTPPSNGDGGGGGGGGGLGVIRMLHGTIPTSNVSPTPTT